MSKNFSFKRSVRLQELLQEEISQILHHGLKDPRIGFATVTRLELTDNLKNAKIFVSIMGSEAEKKDTLEGLSSAKGFIRSQLGKNLYVKYVPELIFIEDHSAEHADKINKLLNEIHHGRGH